MLPPTLSARLCPSIRLICMYVCIVRTFYPYTCHSLMSTTLAEHVPPGDRVLGLSLPTDVNVNNWN